MSVIRHATSLVTLLLLVAGIAHPQKRCRNLAPRESTSDLAPMPPPSSQASKGKEVPGKKLLIVADNQEHVLTGVQLFSMGLLSEFFLSSTAMRPPLAHVGGRLVLGEALRFGKRQGAETVLHLGDATNISCRDELTSVFNTLDKEAVDEKGNAMWFMAPGNHDGMLAGNLAGYQPRLDYQLTEKEVEDFYSEQRPESQISKQKAWVGACLSPNWEYTPDPPLPPEPLKDPGDRPSLPPNCDYKPSTEAEDVSEKTPTDMLKTGILTRGDAIKLYVERLSKRKGFSRVSRWEEPINVEGTEVVCDVEKIALESHGYSAIASICRLTKLKNDPYTKNWVGPFASHIVQKVEVEGTPIIMLDTSDYDNPSKRQVPFKGKLTCRQQAHADYLLSGKNEEYTPTSRNRNKLIIAGHHPISDFPRTEKRWIADRTSRYMSAHVHTSTKLISHRFSEQLKLVELNIASTLDDPQQVVIAKIAPSAAMIFRVVEAGSSKTGSPGFLEQCARTNATKNGWELRGKFYRGYWRGTYVNRLLESLEKAAERAPTGSTLSLPRGETLDDWRKLEQVLDDINSSEGITRAFWACQSFYASKANRDDRSLFESVNKGWVWLKDRFRPGARSACNAATGEWFSF